MARSADAPVAAAAARNPDTLNSCGDSVPDPVQNRGGRQLL